MDERNKILNQLQDGKITPEQAAKQLEALKGSQSSECCKIIIHPSTHAKQSESCCKTVIIKSDCCDVETTCCEPEQKNITTCCSTQ